MDALVAMLVTRDDEIDARGSRGRGRAPTLWEALLCLVCCRPRRERHNYRHGRDPYYDDDGGCCCGGRRRRTVYVEPIYPYGAPVRPRPEAYAGYAHPV